MEKAEGEQEEQQSGHKSIINKRYGKHLLPVISNEGS